MNEFEKQLEENLQSDIKKFLTDNDFSEIKELYKNNFDKIKNLIKKFGTKSAVEDISNLDTSLSSKISNNILFLKEINHAISTKKLKLENL